MSSLIPAALEASLLLADSSWQPTLCAGLIAMAEADPGYLPALAADTYLPTDGRLFAAFAQPLPAVRYMLIGEGPYPRADSATGVCFMDGAVRELWSERGLSKRVNRATSLRNFMKMLLVSDGLLDPAHTSGTALETVAQRAAHPDSDMIEYLPQLQAKLEAQGFLLLNATLVYRPHVPPLKEARAWQPFLQQILQALVEQNADTDGALPTLVLWGKVAQVLHSMPVSARFPQAIAEHPYNLSFIQNAAMQQLFGPMHLLRHEP